jgi:hypothetical protein
MHYRFWGLLDSCLAAEEDANRFIDADFAAGMNQYIYYSFDKETQRYSRIESGVSSPIYQ